MPARVATEADYAAVVGIVNAAFYADPSLVEGLPGSRGASRQQTTISTSS
jgi:hypothetical protein